MCGECVNTLGSVLECLGRGTWYIQSSICKNVCKNLSSTSLQVFPPYGKYKLGLWALPVFSSLTLVPQRTLNPISSLLLVVRASLETGAYCRISFQLLCFSFAVLDWKCLSSYLSLRLGLLWFCDPYMVYSPGGLTVFTDLVWYFFFNSGFFLTSSAITEKSKELFKHHLWTNSSCSR